MGRSKRAVVAWWSGDGAPAAPWTAPLGGGTFDTDEQVLVLDNSIGGVRWYEYRLAGEKGRIQDVSDTWVTIEATLRLVGGSGGGPSIGIGIRDGVRHVQLLVGQTGAILVRGDTGDELAADYSRNYVGSEVVLRLEKRGTQAWVGFVDGEPLLAVPYQAGGTAPLPPFSYAISSAAAEFGILYSGYTREVWATEARVGVDDAIAHTWFREKLIRRLPSPLRSRFPPPLRAFMHSIANLAETAARDLERAVTDSRAMLQAYPVSMADRPPVYEAYLRGDQLPNDAPPGEIWNIDNPGGASSIAVVRERIRIIGETDQTGFRVTFNPQSAQTGTQVQLRTRIVGRSFSPDSNGRLGPVLTASVGDAGGNGKMALAAFVYTNADGGTSGTRSFRWMFVDDITGAVSPVGQSWIVAPEREHYVEVRVERGGVALLLVDDAIVDRVAWADLPSSNPMTVYAGISGVGDTGVEYEFDVSDVRARLVGGDDRRRALFEGRVIEGLFPTSGCDTVPELDTWLRHSWGSLGLRGTTTGLYNEVRRLACRASFVNIALDETPGQWFLERSYPEITPIHLEVLGTLGVVVVEYNDSGPYLTPQALANVIQELMLPFSTRELKYQVAVVAVVTGGSTPWTFEVDDTRYFAVGDQVTVRNAANTVRTDVTITALTDDTITTTAGRLAAAGVGSVIRKILVGN